MSESKTLTMRYYENPLVCASYAMDTQKGPGSSAIRLFEILRQFRDFKRYENGCIVDFGCGPLNATQPFIQFGLTNVIGVDNSPSMLNLATLLHHRKSCNLYTVKADLHKDVIPAADGIADVVIAVGLMVYLVSMEHIFHEAARLLKPGGYFTFVLEATHTKLTTPYIKHKYNGCHMLYIPEYRTVEALIDKNGFEILHVTATPDLVGILGVSCNIHTFLIQKK